MSKTTKPDQVTYLMWKFLLAMGGRLTSESYYGDCIDTSVIDKEAVLNDIDWSKTTAPVSDVDSIFNGTFAGDEYVSVFKGTLTRSNGTEEKWKYQVEREVPFGDMMRLVLEFIAEDEA